MRQKEDKTIPIQDKARQNKTTQDKTRQLKTRQEKRNTSGIDKHRWGCRTFFHILTVRRRKKGAGLGGWIEEENTERDKALFKCLGLVVVFRLLFLSIVCV
jgi:hypothetical protein